MYPRINNITYIKCAKKTNSKVSNAPSTKCIFVQSSYVKYHHQDQCSHHGYWGIHSDDDAYSFVMRAPPSLTRPRQTHIFLVHNSSSQNSSTFLIFSSLAFRSIEWRLQETPTILNKIDTWWEKLLQSIFPLAIATRELY